MSRLLSYFFVALAAEVVSVAIVSGDETLLATDRDPAHRAKPDAVKPIGDANDPFAPGAAPVAAGRYEGPCCAERNTATAHHRARSNASGPSASEARIKQVLDSPTQIEFVETPLKDVVDYLKDLHHIEIQIDTEALKKAGVDESVRLRRISKVFHSGRHSNSCWRSFPTIK